MQINKCVEAESTALILADLEGIYNIYSLDDETRCKALYCEEVRIYIDALIESGIERIDVCDIHDQGNLLFDLIPIYNSEKIRILSTIANLDGDTEYEFAILVGFHGMAGSNGILPHTLRFNFRKVLSYSETFKRYIPIGEVEIYSRYLAGKGIPVIMVSGDREAVYEANCFNVHRKTCCVKSLYANRRLERSRMEKRVRACMREALELDYKTCLSNDDANIYILFYNEDAVEYLKEHGYNSRDNALFYENCYKFISEAYILLDYIIEFDKECLVVNRAFLQSVRKRLGDMDKTEFDNSEIGMLLKEHTVYSLDSRTRRKVLERLEEI